MNKTNHLIQETSPYLKQHAQDPVDWYPWSEEAFEKARTEDKPILLSIGYTACHWCHVMARESFKNEETAKLMNELFINIKLDREERPDLDKIFQTAHYVLTQHPGGWPLTIFLFPEDQTPFYSGTYFPHETSLDGPTFKEILLTVADTYKKNKDDIIKQNRHLVKILNYQISAVKNLRITNAPLEGAKQFLQQNFDTQYGGFGNAPKFPNTGRLNFLMLEKSRLASATLTHMAEGGIYDQVGGGFFRYSIDPRWQVPHFEKMLYDNALLLFTYSVASQLYNQTLYATIASEIADWGIANMQSPEGGFYSSIDADSEGKEGKYYVWNKFEIQESLEEKEGEFVDLYYNLSQPPNFEKKWQLHVAMPLEQVASQLRMTDVQAHHVLRSIKKKLLAARQHRVPPAFDKKILTAWNSLMIKGLAVAGDILQEPRYSSAAHRALEFVRDKLWHDQRLSAVYIDGKAKIPAYLDDYAYLLDAVITLLQISWNKDHLELAVQLADNLLTYFYDEKKGGFFFTAKDQKTILYRPKNTMDEAMPSGNSIALQSLLTLGHLLGERRYLEAVQVCFSQAWPALSQYPMEHCGLLFVLNNYLFPPKMIIIRGEENALTLWREYCKYNNYLRHIVFAIPDNETDLPRALAARKPKGKICAYVCQGKKCLNVIEEFAELEKVLRE